MFSKYKQLLAAAFLGATMFFGCGDECEHPEQVYSISEQVYERRERSSDFNIKKEILVGETVTGEISLRDYKPDNYIPPNWYVVGCGTKEEINSLEFVIIKVHGNDSYELIGSNSMDWRSYYESEVLTEKDFEGVERIVCGISLPKIIIGNEGELIQEYEVLGVVEVKFNSREECFDWHYDEYN